MAPAPEGSRPDMQPDPRPDLRPDKWPDKRIDKWLGVAALAGLLVVGAAYSLYIGTDANFDLKNYHLYAPHAWLHDLYLRDVAPAKQHSFHNPFGDLPLHALVAGLNDRPRLIAVLLALPYGLAAWLVLQIALRTLRLGWPGDPARVRWPLALLATLLGATGAATRGTVGSSMNEIPIAACFLAAILVVVRRLEADRARPLALAAAGLLIGVAGGLKMSAAPHGLAIGLGLFALLLAGRVRAAEFLASGAGVVAGLLVSLGPWAWYLADTFGNPLFPYFNHVFASPWVEALPYADTRFLPPTLAERLAMPFAWALQRGTIASEVRFRDPRLALTLVLLALAGLALALRRLRGAEAARAMAGAPDPRLWPAFGFLAIYVVACFLVWANSFAIYRYLVPIELVAGPLVLLCLRLLLRTPRPTLAAAAAVLVLAVATTAPQYWGRVRPGERFVDVVLPALPEDALVVTVGDLPLSYLAPFLPASTRFVAVDNSLLLPGHPPNGFTRAADALLAARAGRSVVILPTDPAAIPPMPTLDAAGLAPDLAGCRPLHSNIDAGLYRVCPLQPVAAAGPSDVPSDAMPSDAGPSDAGPSDASSASK